MPKFKKEKKKKSKKKKNIPKDKLILRSVKISAILAGIFLTLSLFFNGMEYFFEGIIVKYIQREVYWDILDNSIKAGVILLAFFL